MCPCWINVCAYRVSNGSRASSKWKWSVCQQICIKKYTFYIWIFYICIIFIYYIAYFQKRFKIKNKCLFATFMLTTIKRHLTLKQRHLLQSPHSKGIRMITSIWNLPVNRSIHDTCTVTPLVLLHLKTYFKMEISLWLHCIYRCIARHPPNKQWVWL